MPNNPPLNTVRHVPLAVAPPWRVRMKCCADCRRYAHTVKLFDLTSSVVAEVLSPTRSDDDQMPTLMPFTQQDLYSASQPGLSVCLSVCLPGSVLLTRLTVQATPPIPAHFSMSWSCHICAACLSRSTDSDAIWQVHLCGPMTHCVRT